MANQQCHNCGSIEELGALRERGFVSCCPERDMRPSEQILERLKLAEDLAKLDRIEAEGRVRLGDPRLTLGDLAALRIAARDFRVTERMAYLRAKDLGLLSYQRGV